MGIVEWVLLGLAVIVVFYGMTIYNNLVRLKHDVDRAWANIDVLLKQRHDELPKLVETARQYMKHEAETLERVMRARSAVADARRTGDVAALGTAEQTLRAGLGSLFAVAAAYPALEADASFRHLQGRISQLENAIADRREFYNATVNNLNVRVEQFPDVLVADSFGFRPRQLLEFDEEELRDVDVRELFA